MVLAPGGSVCEVDGSLGVGVVTTAEHWFGGVLARAVLVRCVGTLPAAATGVRVLSDRLVVYGPGGVEWFCSTSTNPRDLALVRRYVGSYVDRAVLRGWVPQVLVADLAEALVDCVRVHAQQLPRRVR